MRIVCERCGATFSVDEKRIPVAGARAACPKCRQQVVLTRPEPEPVPEPVPEKLGDTTIPDQPAPLPYPALAPAPAGLELPELPERRTGRTPTVPLPADPLERGGHTTGQYAVPDAAAAAYASATGRVTGQTALDAAVSSWPPAASAATGDLSWPPSAPAPAGPVSVGRPAGDTEEDPFGFLSSPSRPTTRPFPGLGATTPEALSFDAGALFELPEVGAPPPTLEQSLPVAEPGAALAAAIGRITEPETAHEPADEWRVKKAGALLEGPFTAAELLARAEAGLVGANDLVAQGADGFQPLSAYPMTASFAKGKATRRATAFASTERAPFPWKGVVAVAGGALLGAFLFTTRPAFLFHEPTAPADRGTLAIIEGWRERESVPIASGSELYQLGRTYYAADTRDGLRKAAETFKRALLKESDDVRTMAAFAEVRALIAIEDGDEVGVRESAELLGYALRHGDALAEPHVARANILALTGTAGDLLVAQQEAQIARRIAPKDPDVLLAVGRAFLPSNADYALQAVRQALKIDPGLRRAPLLVGEANLRLGKLAEARAAFEERRDKVPEDAAADLRLAELDASVGRFDRARRRLALAAQKNPKLPDLRLLHAEIAYQIDGDLETARQELDALLAQSLDRKRRVRALIHAAAVASAQGRLEDAEALIKAGLEIEPDSAPLHFRRALVRLQQRKPDEAKAALAKAAAEIPDRAQKATVQGRIAAALGEVDLAQGEFSRAMLLSPLRVDPYLLGAAMYAQLGAQSQALALARRALGADPSFALSHRALSEFHESPGHLKLAVGGLELLASSQDEPALAFGAVAVARYHTGDLVGAQKAAKRAVATGRPALAARLYLAQMALDRRDGDAALGEVEAALETDRQCGLAYYLEGRALSQLGRLEEAHARYRDALEADPNFVPALVRDAEALSGIGHLEQALALLRKAYKRDPEDIYVRRGLDALEQGEAAPAFDAAIEGEAATQTP